MESSKIKRSLVEAIKERYDDTVDENQSSNTANKNDDIAIRVNSLKTKKTGK